MTAVACSALGKSNLARVGNGHSWIFPTVHNGRVAFDLYDNTLTVITFCRIPFDVIPVIEYVFHYDTQLAAGCLGFGGKARNRSLQADNQVIILALNDVPGISSSAFMPG